jgi:hypothetical protein
MEQKVIFPNFNSLTSEQKELVREWVELLISFRSSTQDLVDLLSIKQDVLESSLPHAWKVKRTISVQIEDSTENTEGTRIEELIPFMMQLKKEEQPIEGSEQFICYLKCWFENRNPCNC